jgi:hypothetical protein
VSAANDRGLAGFWQPIETAADSLATALPQTLPAVLANLVDLLAGDLIPRLRAEEEVLLPLVSAELEPSRWPALNCSALSRLTETISILAARPTASDIGRVHRTASSLLALLAEQRQAEATLVARIRALPAAGGCIGPLSGRLEEEAQASRASQFFFSEADRLPTEAWVLRHNPKAARIGRVAPGRTSPVADLVAALESGS